MKKLLSLFGVGLFVALLFNGHATGAVFAKYDGVDGEGNKGGNAETTWKVEKGEK